MATTTSYTDRQIAVQRGRDNIDTVEEALRLALGAAGKVPVTFDRNMRLQPAILKALAEAETVRKEVLADG